MLLLEHLLLLVTHVSNRLGDFGKLARWLSVGSEIVNGSVVRCLWYAYRIILGVCRQLSQTGWGLPVPLRSGFLGVNLGHSERK